MGKDEKLWKSDLRDKICHLTTQIKGEWVRVTVRMKQLWHDFRRARDS